MSPRHDRTAAAVSVCPALAGDAIVSLNRALAAPLPSFANWQRSLAISAVLRIDINSNNRRAQQTCRALGAAMTDYALVARALSP